MTAALIAHQYEHSPFRLFESAGFPRAIPVYGMLSAIALERIRARARLTRKLSPQNETLERSERHGEPSAVGRRALHLAPRCAIPSEPDSSAWIASDFRYRSKPATA